MRIPLRSAALLLTATFVLASSRLPACQDGADVKGADVKELYTKKLQSGFLAHAPWIVDYDAARKEAKAAGHVLLAYFTRSYAP
jgi:hypothetical protein